MLSGARLDPARGTTCRRFSAGVSCSRVPSHRVARSAWRVLGAATMSNRLASGQTALLPASGGHRVRGLSPAPVEVPDQSKPWPWAEPYPNGKGGDFQRHVLWTRSQYGGFTRPQMEPQLAQRATRRARCDWAPTHGSWSARAARQGRMMATSRGNRRLALPSRSEIGGASCEAAHFASRGGLARSV